DPGKALLLYKKSADAGNARGQVELVEFYEGRDINVAFELCKKYAENGNLAARYLLGNYHLKEIGTEKNIEKTKNHFQQAADLGLNLHTIN
ncbi:8309_t:CDS:1, partial [Ambispora gerdemannii]